MNQNQFLSSILAKGEETGNSIYDFFIHDDIIDAIVYE